jgi:choline kinase
MKTIILSAGQGKRLLPLTKSRPKCMVPLAGRTLIEWQLRALAANGVEDVVVVVGFGAAQVEALLARTAPAGMRVRTVFNPFYAVADNIGSCYVALPEMTGDFLLLNGDTLFEPAVLGTLLAEADAPVTVTIDVKERYDDDDMKVSLDEGRRLRAIGKALPPDSVHGESIGMLLFLGGGGAGFAAKMGEILREPDGARHWYLSVIDRMARAGAGIGTVPIVGHQWGEVDYPHDAERAERLVEAWIKSGRFDREMEDDSGRPPLEARG